MSNPAKDDQIYQPLTLREREQMTDLQRSIKQVILTKGYPVGVILLTLVNMIADLLANFVANDADRWTRTTWIATNLPLYVRAYEQKEKRIDG